MGKSGAGGAASSGRGTNSASGGLALPDATRRKILGLPATERGGNMISARALGLPVREGSVPFLQSRERRQNIPISKISLGRPELNRDRLLNAANFLRNGLRAGGRRIEPIRLAQRPDGRYQVLGDGNHRIAALRLMAFSGSVPALVRLQRKK